MPNEIKVFIHTTSDPIIMYQVLLFAILPKEALSNNPVRSGADFDLLEVSSFSVDRVPLGPDSVDSR